MGCLQSKDANLPAPEKYLKSRANLDISVSQKNSRTGSLLTDPETGVSPRTKSWTTYAFPEAWHRSLDGSIESRFMKLTDEKGETVMRVGRRGPAFDPLYYLKQDHGAFSEMQNRDKTQVRTADGTLKACVAFHMCTDINIFESFGAKGIDGPGYVVYGTTPHFKGQPPTENFNGIVPLFAWAKVCACENRGGKMDVAVYTAEEHFFSRTASFVVKMSGEGKAAVEKCEDAGIDAGDEDGSKPGLMLVHDGDDSAHGAMEGLPRADSFEEGENRDDRLPHGRRQRFVLAGGSDAAFFICTYVATVSPSGASLMKPCLHRVLCKYESVYSTRVVVRSNQ